MCASRGREYGNGAGPGGAAIWGGMVASAPVGMGMYDSLRRRGWVNQLVSAVTRRDRSLSSLTQAVADRHVTGRRDVGLATVSIARITGSEGRCCDFDREFNPLQDHTRQRWLSIAKARAQGIPLPPVDLIQVQDSYYVRDGHHRISVARALGQEQIEANVRMWELAEPEAESAFEAANMLSEPAFA